MHGRDVRSVPPPSLNVVCFVLQQGKLKQISLNAEKAILHLKRQRPKRQTRVNLLFSACFLTIRNSQQTINKTNFSTRPF